MNKYNYNTNHNKNFIINGVNKFAEYNEQDLIDNPNLISDMWHLLHTARNVLEQQQTEDLHFNATPHDSVRMIELPHRDAIVFTYKTYGQYRDALENAKCYIHLAIEKTSDDKDYRNNNDAYPDLFVLTISNIGDYTVKQLNDFV